jgi:hypothetical protein
MGNGECPGEGQGVPKSKFEDPSIIDLVTKSSNDA